MPKQSRHRQTIGALFAVVVGTDLDRWMADRLDTDDAPSWRQLEDEITAVSDGHVRVSHVTLSRWFGEVRNAT